MYWQGDFEVFSATVGLEDGRYLRQSDLVWWHEGEVALTVVEGNRRAKHAACMVDDVVGCVQPLNDLG